MNIILRVAGFVLVATVPVPWLNPPVQAVNVTAGMFLEVGAVFGCLVYVLGKYLDNPRQWRRWMERLCWKMQGKGQAVKP